MPSQGLLKDYGEMPTYSSHSGGYGGGAEVLGATKVCSSSLTAICSPLAQRTDPVRLEEVLPML